MGLMRLLGLLLPDGKSKSTSCQYKVTNGTNATVGTVVPHNHCKQEKTMNFTVIIIFSIFSKIISS